MDMNETTLQVLDLNRQAAMLIQVGNVDEASKKLDQAIEIDPMIPDTYRNYGDLYMVREDYAEAKNSYKKAILIEKNGLYYFLYGNACFMTDDFHEGLKYYNLAVEAGYDDDEMMFFMGLAYERANDEMTALRYYNKALLKNPSRPDYMVKQIEMMIRLEDYENAEKAADEMIVVVPDNYEGYHYKTSLLLKREAFDEAVSFSKKAADKFPEDADLMYDYCNSLTLAGHMDDALSEISKAKRFKHYEESKRQFLLLEAEIYAEKGDFDSAKKACLACIESADEFEQDARFLLMNLYVGNKEFESGYAIADQLVQHHDENSFYYAAVFYRAICLKELGKKEESEALFRDASMLYRVLTLKNPDALDAYLYRALCFKELAEYDRAMEILDFLDNLDVGIAETYLVRADIYDLKGMSAEAKAQREKAAHLKPILNLSDDEVDE